MLRQTSPEGLNMFRSTNLTLNSDVDQYTSIFGSHESSLAYQWIITSINRGSYMSAHVLLNLLNELKKKK